jgi:pyruvate formate lyase activating enzyme
MAMRVVRSPSCLRCGFCESRVFCHAGERACTGCGNCVKGCPAGARRLVPRNSSAEEVSLQVDGEFLQVPAGTSLGDVLRAAGKGHDPRRACGTGGCWDCGVLVDGELSRACAVPVVGGMQVSTSPERLRELPPRRIVSFFPNHLHASVSVFTHGCNFSCDFCHNWDLAFASAGRALTPEEAATHTRRLAGSRGNRRTGISGGEPTLNRRWLVEYIGNLRGLCPGVRVQVDTNASLLTPDYVDELWEAGMTDLTPDLKGLELAAFQRITGVGDTALAVSHLEGAWRAVEDVVLRYRGRLNVSVAIPFHPELIGIDELRAMGERLAALQRGLDVNLMVYQPAFRMRLAQPARDEAIDEAVEVLEDAGLTVWCQEGDDIPAALDPEDCVAESEEFF